MKPVCFGFCFFLDLFGEPEGLGVRLFWGVCFGECKGPLRVVFLSKAFFLCVFFVFWWMLLN